MSLNKDFYYQDEDYPSLGLQMTHSNSVSLENSSNVITHSESQSFEISPLLSSVNIMILESSTDQLDLVISSYRKMTFACEEDSITYIPPELRFGFSDEIIHEENLKIKLSNEVSEFSRLIKILTLIREVLKLGITDLAQTRTIRKLNSAVEDLRLMRNDEQKIFATYKKMYKLHYKLIEEAISEKQLLLEYIRRAENDIIQIRGKLEDNIKMAGVEYFTVLAWEASRIQQNMHIQMMKENTTTKMINEKKNSTDDEKIAHHEMTKFYLEDIEDLKEDILRWMVKYDEDLDATDISIMKMRIEVEDMRTELQNLQDSVNERNREMKEWKDYKIRKKLEAKRIAIEIAAAVVIQNWWRSILVKKKIIFGRKKKKRGKTNKKKLTKKKK